MPEQSTNRRTLVKGLAWATPVVLATSAVPAYAASRETAKSLQGKLLAGKSCRTAGAGTSTLYIDGTKETYPTGGLWVGGVSRTDRVTNASMTIYFPTSLGTLTWVNTRLAADPTYVPVWTTPTLDSTAPVRSGYNAYTIRYSGGWAYNATDRTYIADVPPKFTSKISYTTCSAGINIYSTRRVSVNGTPYTFTRGPVLL